MERIGDHVSHEPDRDAASDFGSAARKRWQQLAEELQADVKQFNARQGGAEFSQPHPNQFRVGNSRSGLELTITADFDSRIIRYGYEQMGDKSAGVPEGGMLSMRQSQLGPVEFYSADRQLTSEETREILLESVLSPPELAA